MVVSEGEFCLQSKSLPCWLEYGMNSMHRGYELFLKALFWAHEECWPIARCAVV